MKVLIIDSLDSNEGFIFYKNLPAKIFEAKYLLINKKIDDLKHVELKSILDKFSFTKLLRKFKATENFDFVISFGKLASMLNFFSNFKLDKKVKTVLFIKENLSKFIIKFLAKSNILLTNNYTLFNKNKNLINYIAPYIDFDEIFFNIKNFSNDYSFVTKFKVIAIDIDKFSNKHLQRLMKIRENLLNFNYENLKFLVLCKNNNSSQKTITDENFSKEVLENNDIIVLKTNFKYYYLSLCEIFLNLFEADINKLLNAAACRLPIISTKFEEMNINFKINKDYSLPKFLDSFIYTEEIDESQIARIISQLLENEDLNLKYRTQSFLNLGSDFSPQNFIAKIVEKVFE